MRLLSSLIKDGFIYTVSNVVNSSVPFLLIPFLTRRLSTEEYGLMTMFLLTQSILNVFVGLNVHGAVSVEFFKRDKKELASFVGSAFLLLSLSFAFVFLVIVFSSNFLEKLTSLEVKWIIAASLTSLFTFVINIRMSLLQSMREPLRYAILQLSFSALNASLSYFLVTTMIGGWRGRVVAIIVATFVFGIICILHLIKNGELKFDVRKSDLKKCFTFGFSLVPHSLGAMLIFASDRILISKYLGASFVGIYMVGFQLSMVLSLLTDSFNRAYSPWLMSILRTDSLEDKKKVVAVTYIYFILVSVMAIFLWLSFTLFGPIVLDAKYHAGLQYTPWILAGFMFGGMYYMVANYLFYVEKTKYLAAMTLTSGVVSIGLNLILIPRWGLNGAGFSFIVSQFVSFLGTWILSSKNYTMPWSKPDFSIILDFKNRYGGKYE